MVENEMHFSFDALISRGKNKRLHKQQRYVQFIDGAIAKSSVQK